MNERLMWKGQLADLKKKRNTLDLKASALVTNLRIMLNPHESDVTRLEVEKIEDSADELLKMVEELRGIDQQIAKLKESLGEED